MVPVRPVVTPCSDRVDREAVALADSIKNRCASGRRTLAARTGTAVEQSMRSARCGKRSLTNGMNRRAAAGFRNSERHQRPDAFARCACAHNVLDSRWLVGEAGNHRRHRDVALDDRSRQLEQGAQSEAGARARSSRVRCSYRSSVIARSSPTASSAR